MSGGTTEAPDSAIGWPKSDQYRLLQPQINANGIHVWPFDSAMPVDLRLLTSDGQHTVQKNRHDYFEIFVLCSGATTFLVEDRLLPMHAGDLAVIGSTLYHSIECPVHAKSATGVLYFDPNLICSDGHAYSAEYLAPFLEQDSDFPHVLPANTGVPGQVMELMRMIHAELPGSSMRGRLAIKTYLKMILMLLVNQYSSYAGAIESIRDQQRALDRLQRFFEFLPRHVGEAIQVGDAAQLCSLDESDFVRFLKQVTGRSFRSYLNHYRVERAQAALAGTNRSISDIALEMGFCDQSYFGAVFLKLAAMTPLAYRRRHHRAAELPRVHMTGTAAPAAYQGQLHRAELHAGE
jgi:AraC-like DNA-binding protein